MHAWTVRHAETREILAQGIADESPTARRDARLALDRLVEERGYPSAYASPLGIRIVPVPAP